MTATTPEHPSGWDLRRVGRVAHEATIGAVRDLVWPDLRDGVIRVRDLRPAHIALVALSSILLVGGIGVLVLAPWVRGAFDLVSSSRGVIGRGSLVPEPLVPVTLLLLAFSSGLVLAGALHVARWARLAVLFGYAMFAIGAQWTAFSGLSGARWEGWIALGSVAAVAVVFAVRWRSEPRPVSEALVMIALSALNLALIQRELVDIDRVTGAAFAVDQTGSLVFLLAGVANPLLLVAGLDVIEFGATATGWSLRFVDERVHQRVVYALLGALVAWRARDLFHDLRGAFDDSVSDTLWAHAGALLLVALVGAVWWLVDTLADRADGDETQDGDITGAARSVGLPLALGYQAVTLLLLLVIIGVNVVGRFDTASRLDIFDDAYRFTAAVNRGSWTSWWRWAFDAAIIVVALVLARRGQRSVALVLAVIGSVDLLSQSTDRGNWLSALLWDDAAVDHVWFLVFATAGITWFLRGTLDEIRAERLFFLVLLGALIRQSDFISDPFAVFLSSAGVGFVAFGLLWGFLTAGSWANEDSPKFPRSARVFVYLGYSLFSITLLNWFVLAHDVDNIDSVTDRLPSFGQYLLGLPMLYAVFAVTFVGAWKRRPVEFSS